MKIGIAFPSLEMTDPGAIREFSQGAEQLGFSYLTALEHVLGTVEPRARSGGREGYTPQTTMHEPLVLFGFIAAVTSSIGLVSSILILPQRQAPLVARQAAEVDHLSNGRLRLGIGLGSNPIEATGVGSDFTNRGARVEEQIEVMRLLWTQEVVTFKGRWHDIQESGITLPPVQRPIPIWMGGGQSDRTLERIGRMSDGWMPGTSGTSASEQLVKIRAAAEAAGRDFSAIGVQGRMGIVGSDPEDWLIAARGWQELGATHLGVNTTRGGFTSPEQHLALAERFLTEVAPQLA